VIAVVFTVGRHTAGDGTGVDPIVAAALLRRPVAEEPGASRHSPDSGPVTAADGDGDGGGLGWPGEPGSGSGLGWPVDVSDGVPADGPRVAAQPAGRRRGWRRLFGGGQDARSSAA
jgi:hypothetical protein